MQVGREDQRDAEHAEEIADDDALLALGRIDRGDEAEPHLLRDHRARDLQRRDRQPRHQAQHRADEQLLAEHQQHRPDGVQIDLIGVAMQRHDHRGQHQRDGEPHAHRHAELAEPGQQHDHRPDPREDQHVGRRERRQERDVDLHRRLPPHPPDDAHRDPRHVALQRVGHERQRDQHGDEDRQDLRHEHQRHFLDLGQRLEQRDRDADRETDQHQRARHEHQRQDGVARDVEHFRSGHSPYPSAALGAIHSRGPRLDAMASEPGSRNTIRVATRFARSGRYAASHRRASNALTGRPRNDRAR